MDYENLQTGYDSLRLQFNGFLELEERIDAGEVLIEQYRTMKVKNVIQFESLVEKGRFCLKFTHIELLLAQISIQKSLSDENILLLLEMCTANYDNKKLLDEYAYFGLLTTTLVMGRLLDKVSFSGVNKNVKVSTRMQRFVDNSTFTSIDDFERINNYSKEYIYQAKGK